ncbi:methyl-accepting chemotaxis protein III [Enterobacter asburiae]|uniref:Methyl-accepting chemotaxis protein III n=1 Tax=Enterobacter asburiae TaxID=61645 RepID=A0A376F9Q6_ENTAS|nr:methyl-accepting chemotaxis protein III [Enterobacter asburiae]
MLLSIFLTRNGGLYGNDRFYDVAVGWRSRRFWPKNISARLPRCNRCRSVKQLDSALTAARDMGNSALALREAGVSERQSLNQLLIHYLSAHPQFLSMSMAFEPNAFDDKDAVWARSKR